MKIYKTLNLVNKTKLTNLAGIYYFKNKISNRYYIGQAMCIKKRFCTHCNLILNNKIINNLYKDILELGFDNFEYAVIGVIKDQENLSKEQIREKLDKYEKYFIKKYNSYKNGYNQTLGGDGGILGYKMTEEQRKRVSEGSKRIANDGRYTIYVYDIVEDKEYLFTSFQTASEYLNVKRDALYSAFRRKNGVCQGRYIPRKTIKELYESLNIVKDTKSKECRKYTIEQYLKIKNDNPTLSVLELTKLMNVCKKTIYNYEHLLENPSFIQKAEIKYKIIDTETGYETIVNAKEGGSMFNISDNQFRKTEVYCKTHNSLYKKKYKIIRLNEV